MTSWRKFEIVLCTIFLTTFAVEVRQPIKILELNGCALKYKKDVADKPDIFFTTVIIPGVCRIQKHQLQSTENYETFRIAYYKKEREYEYGQYERGPILPGTIQKMNVTNYQALTYDVRTKTLIYIDKPLFKSDEELLVRRHFNDSHIIGKVSLENLYRNSALRGEGTNDLAYDWRTKNLFVNNKAGIAVTNFKKTSRLADIVVGSVTIMSFAIHPNAGYLFFVEFSKTEKNFQTTTSLDGLESTYRGEFTSKIYRTSLDGTNKRQIGPTITHREAFIANLVVDYHSDRLYWAIPHMNVIQSSNLEGNDTRDIIHRELFYGLTEDAGRSISFDKKYVYYIAKNRSIRRFDKESLQEDEDFEIVNEADGLIAEMVVYDPDGYKITTDHPCLIDNGACEEYCLALPEDRTKMGASRTCLRSNNQ